MENASTTILKHAGLTVTRQRTTLLDVLMERKRPMSTEEIKSAVGDAMNLTTVYRILDTLVAAGAVYQTDFRDGRAYFEYQDSHHHHIVCTSCGRREETTVCVDEIARALEEEANHFHSIHGHTLEFFGLCDSCRD